MERRMIIIRPKLRTPITRSHINRMNENVTKNNRCLKRKTVRETSDIVSEVGIHGLNKVFNSNYSKFGKAIWAVAIATSFVFCVSQISKRVSHFMTMPYSLEMNLTRDREAEFPAVSICPFYPFFYSKKVWNGLDEYVTIYDSNEEWNMGYFLNLLNLSSVTASDIWEYGHAKEVYRGMICQALSTKKNCNLIVNVVHFTTYLGICAKYEISDILKYDGPYNGMKIEFSDQGNAVGVGYHYIVMIHHPDDDMKHRVYGNGGTYLKENTWTQIKLATKKYIRFNSWRRPCRKRREVEKCIRECTDNHIRSNISCRLPYMNDQSGLPMCDSPEPAKQSYLHTLSIYDQADVICQHCPKPCFEYIYSRFDTIFQKVPNMTRMSILYHDNLADVIEEKGAYPFSLLLADVGGTLGLFLGVCLLSMLQFLEAVFVTVKKRILKYC